MNSALWTGPVHLVMRPFRLSLGWLPLAVALFLSSLQPTAIAQEGCLHTKRGNTSVSRSGEQRDLASMDILHQRITLDLTLGNLITGKCMIRSVPREDGVDHVELDLIALTVDSVTAGNSTLSFTQSPNGLDIGFTNPLGTADTIEFTVHYGGDPVVDASGFGGFYTSTSLIYNLGVAFESVPHSYGRAWFPCMDNFTERSTYEFIIKTAGGKRAWCNGALVDRTPLGGDTLLNHWLINESIPAYLPSVAAANFVVARDTFANVSGGQTPVELIASAGDTTGMKNSFVHLPDAFDHFEALFGPYRWEKVGYVLTPVGAMEHATSIHYPRSIADGSLQNEDIMAHELAHHWFGDLVTCDRAEEMYINEGFAEYLSYLFLEDVNGRDRYMTTVRSNHKNMVHRAHLIDEGWWTLSEMPQDWTYGEHSYNKGADVLHTLRSYLGDEAFSAGLTSFLTAYAFQPVNTIQIRDHLSAATGIDLTDFFTDWIQQPGWAAFEIDAQTFNQVGEMWSVELTIGQKQRGPSAPYHNVPVTFAVIGTDVSNVYRDTVLVGGESSQVTLTVPFEPAWVWLNDDDRISLAVTGVTDTTSTTASVGNTLANFELRPAFAGDPLVVRMEQYWVAADDGEFVSPFAYVISPDRYWRLTGNWTDATRFTARISFDGRNTTSGSLDLGLMEDADGVAFHEDSLVVLHRSGPDSPWTEWSDQVVTFGSATDKFGRMDLDSVRTGEYVLAWRKSAVGIHDPGSEATHWTVRPNPASDLVWLETDRGDVNGQALVLDATGREVRRSGITGRTTRIALTGLAPGNYSIQLLEPNGRRTALPSMVVVE